jgi:hypothetical protein
MKKKPPIEAKIDDPTTQALETEPRELVACQSVMLDETKHPCSWELPSRMAARALHERLGVLKGVVEVDKEHHLHYPSGLSRESTTPALGLPAVLPPPDEGRQIESATRPARPGLARRLFAAKVVPKCPQLHR